MAEISPNGLPADIADAVDRYIAEDCPGDLNDYLDAKGIAHPQFKHHILEPGEEFNPEVVGGCGQGYYGSWVKARDGHWWSTCVPINN